MLSRRLRRWLRVARLLPRQAETSRLVVGSTGSGKSEGELVDLVRLADRGDHAVVLLDGHGPLAFRAAGHWAARGHEHRLVYEPLDATDRVLCWDMLPRSAAKDPVGRRIRDADTRAEVAECFMSQRDLESLNEKPWTKEWLDAAISLCLSQPRSEPLGSLPAVFRYGSAECRRLLRDSDRGEVVAKFRDLDRLRRRSEVQYELQTGGARRLLELVCDSEVARLRSRPGPFDWLAALRQRRLIAFDGGGIRTRELKRTLFLLASMQVIHAVRRHFAETQHPLPVVLVLEEAGSLGLVTPFVLAALRELRKAGLAIHTIVQSTVDLPDRDVLESVMSNTPWQSWYQVLSPADQEIGGRALANAAFDPMSVHFIRTRAMPDGVERVVTGGHGKSIDPATGAAVRCERWRQTVLRTCYRHVVDAYYRSPQLVEQEFRTALATLRIGERLVRDRGGVWRERVRPVRSRWWGPVTDDSTRAAIARVRHEPIYLAPPGPEAPPPAPLDAAARLLGLG